MDSTFLMAALEAIAQGLATALLGWLQKVAEQPTTMTDVSADPGLKQELQNDLEAQIAGGNGQPPA